MQSKKKRKNSYREKRLAVQTTCGRSYLQSSAAAAAALGEKSEKERKKGKAEEAIRAMKAISPLSSRICIWPRARLVAAFCMICSRRRAAFFPQTHARHFFLFSHVAPIQRSCFLLLVYSSTPAPAGLLRTSKIHLPA